MPPVPIPSRQQSQSPAGKAPSNQKSQSPSGAATIRQPKRKGKNAAGRADGSAKAETKAVSEEITGASPPDLDEDLPAPVSPPPTTTTRPKNAVASSVMDALISLEATNEADRQTMTDSWTKSIPFGRSPPTDIMDERPKEGTPPKPSYLTERGFSQTPPSASPRTRPLSYPSRNGSVDSTRDRQQRYSLLNQYPNPPPPHLPQAHFYSAPDFNLPFLPNKDMPPEGFSYCAFDELPNLRPKSKYGGKVLLLGSEGSLDVLVLKPGKTHPAGRLSGLSGRVIEAKILTWHSKVDPFAQLRPLVAVTLHGPALRPDVGDDLPVPEAASAKISMQGKADVPQVQTRVEVYSLRSQHYITTLFSTKPVVCSPLHAPFPIGSLKLHTSGNYAVVASGVSGEVFIYTVVASPQSGGEFHCLGKTWARVRHRDPRRYSDSSNSTETDETRSDMSGSAMANDVPLLSICGRWLAVVCPQSTAKGSINGDVPLQMIGNSSCGVDSHAPPARPSVTCAVDSGEGESMLSKLSRGVTQEFFRASKWLGDQGVNTWNAYWNKDRQPQSATLRPPPHYPADAHLGHGFFPPTHSHETQSARTNEPEIISVFDLKKLEEISEENHGRRAFPNPIATFEPSNGCSFLSFAPSGLMLMTISKNGDLHYVWDLMQMKKCRAMTFVSDNPVANGASPSSMLHVRQVALFSRMTKSSVVDVVWSNPSGENLVIISKAGSAHVYNLPRNAFQWPPLRRATSASPPPTKDGGSHDETPDEMNAGHSFAGVMKLVGEKTQPFLAAMRGRAPSLGSAFTAAGLSTATGVGSKAVAAGLSKSVEAAAGTVNTFRHAGENRLRVSDYALTPSQVVWFGSDRKPFLGTINDGYSSLYNIIRGPPPQSSTKPGSVAIGSKRERVKLPSAAQAVGSDEQSTGGEGRANGFWSLPSAHDQRPAMKRKSLPLSHAEIESNAPYQPFHTDRRVALMVYPPDQSTGGEDPCALSVFGEDIPTVRLNIGRHHHSDDEQELDDHLADGLDADGDDMEPAVGRTAAAGRMENHISVGSVGGQVEHIVITTRRKRRKSSTVSGVESLPDEDGFFEDDCDVLDFARDRV